MNRGIGQLKKTLSHIGKRSIMIAFAVIFITAGIAIYIGVRFYETEKEVLHQQGEINASKSAMEYERFLLTHANIVSLAGDMVDNMILSGSDTKRIEKYLTDETKIIMATLDPTTTGLYGWVNGEYLDGAGWVPDEDYVATERPWYIQTVNSKEKITFVEPYLDVHTNSVMMTVAELMNDGESVIAMDVSLDSIQKIVESIASSEEGSQAFVVDESGSIVVHSNQEEIGKNYLEETDGPGPAAAARLLINNEKQFDIKTADGSYSVYADALEGGWYSVSLINAELWYRPLRRTIFVFSLILILIIAFLITVFLRLSEKNLQLERLTNRISQEEKRGDVLQILSETDRMTGLNDRVSGKQKVDELLAEGKAGMFVEFDIDHFKNINDTYGHQAGDQVILAVADAIRSTFRTGDVTMRLGGDEFGVFAVGIADPNMGETIVKRFFAKIESQEIQALEGRKIFVSAGAVLTGSTDTASFDSLYALADEALYISKKTSGSSLTFHRL